MLSCWTLVYVCIYVWRNVCATLCRWCPIQLWGGPCACVAIRRVSHNTVCMYIIRIYIGRNVCACYLVRIMSNPIMRRFHVQGCVVAQPRLCYHGHQRPKHVVLRSRSKPLLVDRTDTLLNEPSFVTTTRITGAPNRLESNCRHKIALVLTTCRF